MPGTASEAVHKVSERYCAQQQWHVSSASSVSNSAMDRCHQRATASSSSPCLRSKRKPPPQVLEVSVTQTAPSQALGGVSAAQATSAADEEYCAAHIAGVLLRFEELITAHQQQQQAQFKPLGMLLPYSTIRSVCGWSLISTARAGNHQALILCVCVCACVCPYYCLTDLAASPVYERLVALATAAAERSGAGHYKHSKGNATVPDHLKGLDRLADPDAPGSGHVQQLEL
eukprot:16226-Heterococcus_DN1.PRE.3